MTHSNLIKNKKFFAFAIFCVLAFLVYLLFVFYNLRSLPGGQTTGVLEGGRFSEMVPEKNNISEAEKKYGKPITKDVRNGVTSLNYDSKEKQQYDFIWTQDDKIIATGERLAENTSLDNLLKKLGTRYVSLYDKDIIPAHWLVFLEKGVALRAWENNAYVLVRFAPQTKGLFLKNIAPIVGISEKMIQETEEPGIEELASPTPAP